MSNSENKTDCKARSKAKVVESDPFKVKIICFLISCFAVMPAFVARGFAWLFAHCSKIMGTRGYKTTCINLAMCLPALSQKERKRLAIKSLKHTGQLFFEASKIWRKCQCEQYIKNIHGEALVKEKLEQGQGILMTGAHIGNWEVALYYLGSRYSFHCMYRPPRQLEMDEVINHGRCKNGTTMVKGDSRGVMHLIQMLKQANVAAVLSDQEPGRGSGVFVPFCGKEALTMTLIQKMQQKSGAALFQIAAIKNDQGSYDIHLEPIEISTELDAEAFAGAVNTQLTGMIKRYPEQYQWSYKRFKTTECGRPNPYCK